MRINWSPISCGVKTITGVSYYRPQSRSMDPWDDFTGPKYFKKFIGKYVKKELCRRAGIGNGGGARTGNIGFVFSDAVRPGIGGAALAKYISRAKIGKVRTLTEFQNYNSGNNIAVWAFTVHPEFLKKCRKEAAKENRLKERNRIIRHNRYLVANGFEPQPVPRAA